MGGGEHSGGVGGPGAQPQGPPALPAQKRQGLVPLEVTWLRVTSAPLGAPSGATPGHVQGHFGPPRGKRGGERTGKDSRCVPEGEREGGVDGAGRARGRGRTGGRLFRTGVPWPHSPGAGLETESGQICEVRHSWAANSFPAPGGSMPGKAILSSSPFSFFLFFFFNVILNCFPFPFL